MVVVFLLPQTIMTRLPVLFLRKANTSGTFESLKAKTLGCGEWTVVPIQLFPRDLRWRSCEGTREGGAVCEARPRHPKSARGLQAAGYVALGRGPSRADATGPEGEAWTPGGRGPPELAVSPFSRGCPSARVPPQPTRPRLCPRPLTRLRGPSITSIDPGVSGGPRRSGGARAHGGAARARRRGGWQKAPRRIRSRQ